MRQKAEVHWVEDFYAGAGHAIGSRRLQLGMSQQELADLVGLGRTSITNIEAGRQRILAHQLLDFGAALNMKPEAIFKSGKVFSE